MASLPSNIEGFSVSSISIVSSSLSIPRPGDNPESRCIICGGYLTPGLSSHSQANPRKSKCTSCLQETCPPLVVNIWNHNTRTSYCRRCDIKIYGDYLDARRTVTVFCFICGILQAPAHEVTVFDQDERIRARMFACSERHLGEVEARLSIFRTGTINTNWCGRCLLQYDTEKVETVKPRFPLQTTRIIHNNTWTSWLGIAERWSIERKMW